LKCQICSREAGENDYCELHTRAYENLIRKYDCWEKALETSWKEYLREIAKNPLTGEWAREVAEHLTKLERKINVKNS
jgi:hypothetical protein